MNRKTNTLYALAIALVVGPLGTSCESSDAIVSPPDRWVLTMSDEFDGAEFEPPNPAMWTYDVGGGGWGNGQLEFNTDRVENVSLDGELYHTVRSTDVPRGKWVFDHEFFMILNLAVGGTLGDPVGPDTVFPAEVLVDYVRIFERPQ